MKTLDTHTVLEIIKMIDVSVHNLEEHLNTGQTNATPEYLEGGIHQLSALNQHLQSYIEGQLNAAENSTGE